MALQTTVTAISAAADKAFKKIDGKRRTVRENGVEPAQHHSVWKLDVFERQVATEISGSRFKCFFYIHALPRSHASECPRECHSHGRGNESGVVARRCAQGANEEARANLAAEGLRD